MQPKVSLVIPCYNKHVWIAGMFDSILEQKWDNIELILVNDGSTDGTREIIAEYEQRFLERGFDVVIIDQENKGTAAAAYAGLLRSTGEYLCQVDSDDRLDPEYVSTMATRLCCHPEDDWVVCDFVSSTWGHESMAFAENGKDIRKDGKYPYNVLYGILFRRTASSAAVVMFRRSYMISCGMLECFLVAPRIIHQETRITIPLALGGAQPYYIRQPFYYHTARINAQTFNDCRKIVKNFTALAKEILLAKGYLGERNEYMMTIFELIFAHHRTSKFPEYNEIMEMTEFVRTVNKYVWHARPIDITTAKASGYAVLIRHFGNKMIGYTPHPALLERMQNGRIIAYGAFGIRAKSVMQGLLNSPLRPIVFWDISAKDNDSIEGIPVVKPDFSDLNANDVVLLLLTKNGVVMEVYEKLRLTPARDTIFNFYDVLDYLAAYYYGDSCNIQS